MTRHIQTGGRQGRGDPPIRGADMHRLDRIDRWVIGIAGAIAFLLTAAIIFQI